MKKIFAICLIVCLLVFNGVILSQQIPTTYAQANQPNFTNLIVFARFNDEEEFVNNSCYESTTVKQLIDNSYSNANYSVKDYYLRVSAGKVNMQNLYLFDNNGSIVLSHNRGYYYEQNDNNSEGYTSDQYYTRLSELQVDWTNAVQNIFDNGGLASSIDGETTYSLNELDKDGDGLIDSITLIFNYSTEYDGQWKGCLWNYQTTTNRIVLSLDSKEIRSNNYVQITYDYNYTYADEVDGMRFANLKTMIHEMGHVFGLKDLYNTQNKSPVYYMSAMSNAISPIPQYISAKEREVLGWLDSNSLKKIVTAGDYSVEVTSSDLDFGVVAYKCDIASTDKTLYLEYRKFDGDKNKYDTLSKTTYNQQNEALKNVKINSGLVCFLIDKDTVFPNNMYCTSANWNYQVLGGTYATKVDAPLKQGDTLSITSDLVVEVKELNDNSLTFSISGADIVGESHTHSFITHEFNDSTCTTSGNIAYKECTTCHKYFDMVDVEIDLNDTIIVAKGHEEGIIPAVDPTCTSTGLTQGKKCNRCGEVLIEQSIIAKKDHTPSDWIVDEPATSENEGSRHKECTECGGLLETETIPKLEPSEPINPDPVGPEPIAPVEPSQPTAPTTPPTDPTDPDESTDPSNPTDTPEEPTYTPDNQDEPSGDVKRVIITTIATSLVAIWLIFVVVKLRKRR